MFFAVHKSTGVIYGHPKRFLMDLKFHLVSTYRIADVVLFTRSSLLFAFFPSALIAAH